jgi:hypothetical protein
MLLHSERRATLQSAKRGPPVGLRQEASRSASPCTQRATSPLCTRFLAEKLPVAITVVQPHVITLSQPGAGQHQKKRSKRDD